MVKKVGEEVVVEEKAEQFGQKIVPDEPVIAESTESEPAQEESIEDLRAKLVEAERVSGEALKEAKAHQQNVSKKERELQREREGKTDIRTLQEKQDIMAAMLADILDRDSAEVETPTARRSEQYLSKLKDAGSSTQKAQEAYANGVFSEINKLATGVGLDLNSRELAIAKNFWYEGKPEDALDEVKQVVEKLAEAKEGPEVKETQAERDERIYQERRKKEMRETGQLNTETGQPAGAALSDEKIRENFRNNPNDRNARQAYLDYEKRQRGF